MMSLNSSYLLAIEILLSGVFFIYNPYEHSETEHNMKYRQLSGFI